MADGEVCEGEGGNWVHKLSGGGDAAAALPRLSPEETFDVIVGSDLLYDASHAEPLAVGKEGKGGEGGEGGLPGLPSQCSLSMLEIFPFLLPCERL